MSITSLQKILCLFLIVCHTLCAAQPINFNNRTANISAQVGLGNQTNSSRPTIHSPDMTSTVNVYSWLVPTLVLSAIGAGCIYAYCKYRRNLMRVHPGDADADADAGGGGGGGDDDDDDDDDDDPNYYDRFNLLANCEARNFNDLPSGLQNNLRVLRRLPINVVGDRMPVEGADERDYRAVMRARGDFDYVGEILIHPGRHFLGHITDRFTVFIRDSNGEIGDFDASNLHARRVWLTTYRYLDRGLRPLYETRSFPTPHFQSRRHRILSITTLSRFPHILNRHSEISSIRILDSYITTQRGLPLLLRYRAGRIIHGYAFADDDFLGVVGYLDDRGRGTGLDAVIQNFERRFSASERPTVFSHFQFYR